MSKNSAVQVLFVCMGNICRSPTAEGVFRHLVRSEGLESVITTDSAGTLDYHVGKPPDRRAQATAHNRGIDIGDLRARRVVEEDFERFDYVLAMDHDNYTNLAEICPSGYEERLFYFLDFADDVKHREVPDPYYGGAKGFELVFDMVEKASKGLLGDIRQRFEV